MLKRLQTRRGDEGFTLIELLVVIIIIGILAAIAIPVFLNQRKKGWDAAVQADLRNAATGQETVLTENGVYTDSMFAIQNPGGFKYSPPANYYDESAVIVATPSGGNGYCLQAQSASGKYFWYDSVTGPGNDPDAQSTARNDYESGDATSPCTQTVP